MNYLPPAATQCRQSTEATNLQRGLAAALASTAASLLFTLGLLAPSTARAVDGCLVLLCFAAPSWKSVPQCVPPIRKVLRDLARGKAFPTCGMTGAGNSARHVWARAPGNCPPQYSRAHETESGPIYTCDYTRAITVTIDGKPFTRTWWDMGGDTVTDFCPVAKSQLGTWDTRYDNDHANWLRSRT